MDIEELALDRDAAAVVQGCNEIDAGVGTAELSAARPVGPEIDVREALRLNRIGVEPSGDQLLERGALVAFADRGVPVGIEKAVQRTHRGNPNRRECSGDCA